MTFHVEVSFRVNSEQSDFVLVISPQTKITTTFLLGCFVAPSISLKKKTITSLRQAIDDAGPSKVYPNSWILFSVEIQNQLIRLSYEGRRRITAVTVCVLHYWSLPWTLILILLINNVLSRTNEKWKWKRFHVKCGWKRKNR